jgi:hypothetical protein
MAKNLLPKPRLITVEQWACSHAKNAKAPHFAKSDFLFSLYHWPHWLRIRPGGGFRPSRISISIPEAMKEWMAAMSGMPRFELDLPCGARRSQARGLGAAIVSLPSREIS